ncbi:hypothetical protein BJX68DRAFT_155602 [Aspergillus pseudodeflectus]|uniref:C2H2-type domain-containing protein n=1 Tax=Aspergillus pseudodeflectus TaxID=176178 RepID=A0ABR4JTU0_9EURO
MQHPIGPSQWLPDDVEEQNNLGADASQHSPRFVPSQQLRASSVSQGMTDFSYQRPGLYLGFASGPDNPHEPVTWSNAIATGPKLSGSVLVQPRTGASLGGDVPGIPNDLRDQIPTERVSGYHFADPHGQEREEWTRSWLTYPPSTDQSPLLPSVEGAPRADRTFQCRWIGCRSVTIFCRESELMRHLKTVHISPKAYPCTQPQCGMAFGRRDHLKAHQRNRHGG